MKTDDPRVTAYALGELPASERSEIEALLKTNPDAAEEAGETRKIAGILKKSLAAEPMPILGEQQRWAIMRLAASMEREGRGFSASERDAVEPAWYERVGVWQTVAACAVFGFGVYAFSVSLAQPSQKPGALASAPEMVIGVPAGGDLLPLASGGPEVLTPKEAQQRFVAAGGPELDAAKAFPNGALIVPPQLAEVAKVEAPRHSIPNPAAKAADLVEVTHDNNRTIISIPDAASIVQNAGGEKAPLPTGSGRVNTKAASMGALGARPPSDENVGAFLLQRMKDAERIGEGSTAAEFEKIFRPDAKVPGRYEMIRCKAIKVDVEFEGGEGSPVKRISKPYLSVQ